MILPLFGITLGLITIWASYQLGKNNEYKKRNDVKYEMTLNMLVELTLRNEKNIDEVLKRMSGSKRNWKAVVAFLNQMQADIGDIESHTALMRELFGGLKKETQEIKTRLAFSKKREKALEKTLKMLSRPSKLK